MNVKKFVNGTLLENSYLVYVDDICLIIDPGSRISELEDFILKKELQVKGILITHYHKDHVGALEYYKEKYKSQVYDYESSKLINIDNLKFEIIKCPGHTNDSVTFYFEKENTMFTGDFLFKETIGNYSDNDEKKMQESLLNIVKFPKETIIYPGHDENSALDHELKFNPYLRGVK